MDDFFGLRGAELSRFILFPLVLEITRQ